MSRNARDGSAGRGLLDGLLHSAEQRVARALAPHMSERFYEVYCQDLVDSCDLIPSLSALDALSMDDGYMPLLVSSNQEQDHPDKIWDAMAQHPRLLVLGPVGAGKSTLLQSLAWRFAGEIDARSIRWLTFKLFGQSISEIVPILIDLEDWPDNYGLLDYFLSSMARHRFPGARAFLTERIEAGQCLLLLDGVDRMARPERLAEVAEMAAAYPNTIWVAAGRPVAGRLAIEGFEQLHLVGVANQDRERYVARQLGRRSPQQRGLSAALERSAALRGLSQRPLMLASMCRSMLGGGNRSARLHGLFESALNTLLQEWPELQTGDPVAYALKDQTNILQHVALQLFESGQHEMTRAEMIDMARERLTSDHKAQSEFLVDEIGIETGIFCACTDLEDHSRFFDRSLKEHLAARALVAGGRTGALLQHAGDPEWSNVIALAAGQMVDPLPLLYGIEAQVTAEPDRWFLLARAIAELRECNDPIRERTQDGLYRLFEDDENPRWEQAAIALAGMSRLTVRDHFGHLVVDRQQSAEMRRRAALVLGRLHQDWAIPSLGTAISDSDASVRQQAAWALGFIPARQAVNVLPRALKSPHAGIREAAAHSLVQQAKSAELSDSSIAALISAMDIGRDDDPAIVGVCETALIEIGPVATPLLTRELESSRLSSEQRSRVARTLGSLGDERALPILIDALLASPDETAGYVQAISGIGERAIPALIDGLQGKDISTSAGLVAALAAIGEPSVQPLIEAIAGDLPEVRNAAVRALEQIGAPATQPLTRALLFDNRYEVRRRALQILGRIGEDHVVDALMEALHDDDIGVRINAVRHLGSLGKPQPVPELIELLSGSDQLPLTHALITSLGEIGDARAVPSLLDRLGDPELGSACTSALTQFEDAAVQPLLDVIHDPETTDEARSVAWDVLSAIGARARPSDHDLFGVAASYALLRQAEDEESVLVVTRDLEWWQHGLELHQSLATAQSLADADALQDIESCSLACDWLGDVDIWMRPHVKTILWAFRDVIENIAVFHSLTRRDAQRNALISALDRLQEVQSLIESTTLPFERMFVDQVVSTWHDTIFAVIKTLRGRASLFVTLLTPSLPIRRGQQVCEAVFQLFNEGDSTARNVTASVHADVGGGGIQCINSEQVNLNPVGIGEERQVSISLAPNRCTSASLVFDVRYDDDERQGVSQRWGFQIGFYDAPAEYRPIERSPYIVGMPVKTNEMFFGRQDIFEWVRENASNLYQEQPLLLYGERRMGKTSVLYQLLQSPPTEDHICLLFDLQLYGYIDTVKELLFELASAIVMRLEDGGMQLDYPEWSAYEASPHGAFRRFCDQIDRRLDSQRLLIMLDEFGVLIGKVKSGTLDASIFDYLRGITQHSSKFTFLFTGAYEVRRMQQDFNSILFNMPKVRKISYLSDGEAQDLILRPVEDMLIYHPLVVPRILRVTAGHPYFIQYICDEMVKLARKQETNYVELNDLEFVIGGVLQDAAGNIENSIYNYLDDSEKLVLAALAYVTDEIRVFVPLGDILSLLQRRHIALDREQALQALMALKERDLVNEMRIGQQLRYSFKMGLTRRWLKQNEILLRIIQEREA